MFHLNAIKDEEDFAQMMVSAGTTSKLDPAIQNLVRMIFDVDSMKQTLLEFEVDFKFFWLFVFVHISYLLLFRLMLTRCHWVS